MGLLESLGLSNPLSDYLEEELSKKIVNQYKEGENNFPDDWRELSGKLKREVHSKIKQIVEEQKDKVKANWKEFNRTISIKVKSAIVTALYNSNLENYSQELSHQIICIPKEILQQITLKELIGLLKKQIGIKDLMDETILALAKYALKIKFDEILFFLSDKREIFHIDNRDYVIVENIENDPYYLDKEDKSQIVNMIVFSEVEKYKAFSINKTEKQIDGEEKRENKKRIKISFAKWENHKNNRPNDRRFDTSKW
jgi:hypothetical protein